MPEYEWGNPLMVMFSGSEPEKDPETDPNFHGHGHLFDHYAAAAATFTERNDVVPPHSPTPPPLSQAFIPATSHAPNFHSCYDPRAFAGESTYAPRPADPVGALPGTLTAAKSEVTSPRPTDFASRIIGLNLGGRTYFSSADDSFVNRLFGRSRPPQRCSYPAPRCQAEGCNVDLSRSKFYHRRHKVCEFHSKVSAVAVSGLTQRFCQQCSRFHILAEFDNGKRSCRKRLADHNRRRRKTHQPSPAAQKSRKENIRSSLSDILARSPAESEAPASSSVTVALSPPQMPLDCLQRRTSHQPHAFSSPSGLLFCG